MSLPLYVDLDGTLVATDTLWESFVLLLKRKPYHLWRLPFWLLSGKAVLKEKIAQEIVLDVDMLPYRSEVLSFIQERRQAGARVVLATAAHEILANRISLHLSCFDGILATRNGKNVSGLAKAAAIRADANGEFAYMGDHQVDVPVWRAAEECILLAHHKTDEQRFVDMVGKAFHRVFIAKEKGGTFKTIFRAMRIHQWAKNSLLFLPLILAHQFSHAGVWVHALIACLAFGFMASSIYLINDLFDLSADRLHPSKRYRPLASGALSIPRGFLLVIGCFALALVLGGIGVSVLFACMLVGYAAATTLYSSVLKRMPIIDVLALAFFYVYRLVAGAVATEVTLTPWLLAFAAFLFVSLGCLKRVSELMLWRSQPAPDSSQTGRGYVADDASMVAIFGVNAGFLSLLVLALYINSAEVVSLYQYPLLLWGVIIALLYWLMRSWLLTWRGKMHDDPVMFALKDSASRWVGVTILVCLFFAL